MKVYAIPDEAPQAPAFSFDSDWQKEEAEHTESLTKWLREQGYTGKHTGGIVKYGVADGHAQYMLADGNGRYGKSFLLHLPYGDAWQYRGIEHFPKSQIVEDIEREKRIAALFSGK